VSVLLGFAGALGGQNIPSDKKSRLGQTEFIQTSFWLRDVFACLQLFCKCSDGVASGPLYRSCGRGFWILVSDWVFLYGSRSVHVFISTRSRFLVHGKKGCLTRSLFTDGVFGQTDFLLFFLGCRGSGLLWGVSASGFLILFLPKIRPFIQG
jgi:hypothetical protein